MVRDSLLAVIECCQEFLTEAAAWRKSEGEITLAVWGSCNVTVEALVHSGCLAFFCDGTRYINPPQKMLCSNHRFLTSLAEN